MASDFDSFDESALGGFRESELGNRGSDAKVLLLGNDHDGFRDVYESMDLEVDDDETWSGNTADYGLIIVQNDHEVTSAELGASLEQNGMEEPGRIVVEFSDAFQSISPFGIVLLPPEDRVSPPYLIVPVSGHPLTEGAPTYSSNIVFVGPVAFTVVGGDALYRVNPGGLVMARIAHQWGLEWVGGMTRLWGPHVSEHNARLLWEAEREDA